MNERVSPLSRALATSSGLLPGAPQTAGSSSLLSGKRLLPAPASSCGMTMFLERDLELFFRDVGRLLGEEEDEPSSSVRSPPGRTPSENMTCLFSEGVAGVAAAPSADPWSTLFFL